MRVCRSHLAQDEQNLPGFIGTGSETFIRACIKQTRESLVRHQAEHTQPAPISQEHPTNIPTHPLDPPTLFPHLLEPDFDISTSSSSSHPLCGSPNGSNLQMQWNYDSDDTDSESPTDTQEALDEYPDDELDLDEEILGNPISIPPLFEIPPCIKELHANLLQLHRRPAKPEQPFTVRELSESETLSLRHYIVWRRSNGTVRAYNKHRNLLEDASSTEIMSLYRVRRLGMQIANIEPRQVDMCPKSCIAYTGDYSGLMECPYIRSGSKVPCGEKRYKDENPYRPRRVSKPRAQVTILPILPSIQALFAHTTSSRHLRMRDTILQEVLKMLGGTSPSQRRYSDFANGSIHQVHRQAMGLFEGERDVAVALSSDGAQLTLKKQSSTWISILMILNLPAEIRYHSGNIIINFAIPGPNAPGDIESFLRPMFEELASGSEGIWIWDAIDSAWFFIHVYLVIMLGDMLGSAKVNGMSGHTAFHGDRFSMIQGARTSLKPGAKFQYYPLNSPDNAAGQYNPRRPVYTADAIETREQEAYWGILKKLANAKTKAELARISKETGVARIPLAASSPAFIHPSFFPLDPFHLFYENCMLWLWDIWSTDAKSGESVWVSPMKLEKLGRHISSAMRTLPPSFCGAIRDPYLKRQSQYKAFEWMALLHWYLLPILLELEVNSASLENFSIFVYIVEQAMTIRSWSDDELTKLRADVNTFLEQFEQLYVGGDPEKIYQCRLCIFQLIHVPIHIKWFGSIRVGSQAPVERSIGEAGHKIHSKTNPFADLSNIIVEKEVIRIIQLYYPDLEDSTPRWRINRIRTLRVFQNLKFSKPQAMSKDGKAHIAAITHLLGLKGRTPSESPNLLDSRYNLQCYGKLQLETGQTLRSRLSEALGETVSRCYRWFEVRDYFPT